MPTSNSGFGDAYDRFEAAWHAGRRPRIERYLSRFPESGRRGLFGLLLAAELGLRRTAGEGPTAEEYLERFLEHAEAVEAAFEVPPADCDPIEAGRPRDDGDEIPCSVALPSFPGQNSSCATIVPGVPPALADHPRYQVVRKLGSGGMGTVYLAEHRLMERPVALKLINRDLSEDAVLRFSREVRAAARLHHPNIVTAFDAEQAGPVHFLVMEFVEGIDLARLVKQRAPLPVAVACDCAWQVALGLQHAHEHGMVHRDIKPQNLMRTRHGRVKILDFGLALFAREVGSSGAFTHSGALLGTPDYMAPEQAEDARAADIRADIYSLGCTLYFLLAGHPPFPGGSLMEKLLRHALLDPQSLGEIRPDLPHGLKQVIDRMIAKKPENRYRTPTEVAEALAPFTVPLPADARTGRPTAPPSVPAAPGDPGVIRRPRQRRTSILAAVALLVVGGGGLLAWAVPRDRPGNQESPAKDIPPPAKVVVGPTNSTPTAPPIVQTGPAAPPITPPSSTPVIPEKPAPIILAEREPPAQTRPVPPPVPEAAPPPDVFLQEKGLKLVGQVYKLGEESAVAREADELRAVEGDLQANWEGLDRMDANLRVMYTERSNIDVTPNLRVLAPGDGEEVRRWIEQHNARESQRARDAWKQYEEKTRLIEELRADRQTLTNKAEKKFDEYQSRLKTWQTRYDLLVARYAKLNRDQDVERALAEVNKNAQIKVVLGPVEGRDQIKAKLARSAVHTLRLRGLVLEKLGRFRLVAEHNVQTQASELRRACEKLKKADAAPLKALEAVPALEKQREKLIKDLAGAVLEQRKVQINAQLNHVIKRIEDARQEPALFDTARQGLRANVFRAAVNLGMAAEALRREEDSLLRNKQEVEDAFKELNKNKPNGSVDLARIIKDPAVAEALKDLDDVRKTIGLQEVPVRNRAGTSYVDASLNNNLATEVIIDPGTARLRLPHALASRAGVRLTPNVATVPVKIADGRTVPCHQAVLGSLHFGPVEIADVPCLVLPPGIGDTPPTVGVMGLGLPAVHFDPQGAKLFLARFPASPQDQPPRLPEPPPNHP